jgi:DNA-binding response OmpR family regulator
MPGKILVIDDHPHMRDILALFLTAGGHQIELCSDGTTALARLASEPFDLIVTDLRLPDLPGLDVVRKAKEVWPQTPTLVMSGASDLVDSDALARRGVDYLLSKPFTRQQFMAMVASALGQPV